MTLLFDVHLPYARGIEKVIVKGRRQTVLSHSNSTPDSNAWKLLISGECRMNKTSRGFSLIELLIVVAIILIIAAIAVPNFLRSRVAANQASAVASLHTLTIAEATYSSTFGQGYSANRQYLAPPAGTANVCSTAAGLIDSTLTSGQKSGYSFSYSPGPSG